MQPCGRRVLAARRSAPGGCASPGVRRQDFSQATPSPSRSDFRFARCSAVECSTTPCNARLPDGVRFSVTPAFAMPPDQTRWIAVQSAQAFALPAEDAASSRRRG